MDSMGDEQEITVDGEVFRVTRRDPSTYDFEWLSGPNEGYGFGTSSNAPYEKSHDELVASIRDFLSMIDPATGYIRD